MRLTRTIVSVASMALLAGAPAFASQHGHAQAPQANGHATAPKSTHATPTTTGTTTTTPTLNPIATKISSHPQLLSKVNSLLKASGTKLTLDQASKDFKNQGLFIAALHVSQNVRLSFDALRTDMVKDNMSLGQAIQKEKHTSTTTATKAATTAEHEADDDVKTSTTTTSKKESHKESESSKHGSVAKQISSNPQLLARVKALLPTGMSLKDAAKGFKSESQFLAALHASKDLGIPFAQIKAEMTGKDRDSLTTAIHELKPTADATAAAKTAQQEASADLKATAPAHGDHDGDDR